MLLNYKCENFGAFRENIEFSMKPGKVTSRFKENVYEISNKLKVSKIAVIVGENAGGKTSFMRSLDYFKFILSDGHIPRARKEFCNKYNDENGQKFKITILVDKKIYTYSLEIDEKFLLNEKLEIRNYNQIKNETIFEINRTKCNIENDSISVDLKPKVSEKFFDLDILKVISNMENSGYKAQQLFVNYLNIVGVDIVRPFMNYISDNLSINLPEEASYNLYKYMERNEKDVEIMKTKEFLEIFRLVDSTITDIEIDEEDPFRESVIIREYDEGIFRIKILRESSGVKEFFAWAIKIWEVIYKNKTVFADEIDKVLNSILAVKVINYIKNTNHRGQFIFSTHNILHLNTNIFMKEQIYFVSKDSENLTSELYSLADFEDYKYNKPNVYELYLKGVFGGVPNA
ncbi:AAA family ATPase [Clostridium perfringens]|uniref:AAA family ATPase n=1 Tax=Clostridium perfringens TaxID=1502 RepID=UPI001C863CE6|nr:AAA family ATPase [Clostridium perfringens]